MGGTKLILGQALAEDEAHSRHRIGVLRGAKTRALSAGEGRVKRQARRQPVLDTCALLGIGTSPRTRSTRHQVAVDRLRVSARTAAQAAATVIWTIWYVPGQWVVRHGCLPAPSSGKRAAPVGLNSRLPPLGLDSAPLLRMLSRSYASGVGCSIVRLHVPPDRKLPAADRRSVRRRPGYLRALF